MTYEMFKEIAQEYIRMFMPEEWKEREMNVRKVHKVNRELDAIAFFGKGKDGSLSPTIYIQDMYDDYLDKGNIAYVVKSAINKAYMASKIQVPDVLKSASVEEVTDKIIVSLVNTEQNRNMLENVPHREIGDISVVYRLLADVSDQGMYSAIVDNRWAMGLGLKEEELYQMGLANSERIFPPAVRSMTREFEESLIEKGWSQRMARDYVRQNFTGPELYIITNQMGMNGSAVVLYEGVLQKLAEELGDDLYVLPSSTHEMLALSAKVAPSLESLADLVVEANMTVVNLPERLSNQVYHYDKDLRKFTMATNTPNKRLDGKDSSLLNLFVPGKDQAR